MNPTQSLFEEFKQIALSEDVPDEEVLAHWRRFGIGSEDRFREPALRFLQANRPSVAKMIEDFGC